MRHLNSFLTQGGGGGGAFEQKILKIQMPGGLHVGGC